MTNLKFFHKHTIKYIVALFFLLNATIGLTQTNSVYQLLLHAEKKYGIVFSFNDEEVRQLDGIEHQLPESEQDFIALLKQKLHLQLIKTDTNNYVLVVPRQVKNDMQTIPGKLLDKRTLEPIYGAEIKSKSNVSVTSTKGTFKLSLQPEDSIIFIKHMAYGTQQINLKDIKDFKSIQIEPKGMQLDEVTINYITTGISKLRDESYTIKPQEQEVVAGLVIPDIFESIQMIPGISNPDEDATSLHIRGGQPDQNLVLWNGIRVYQTGHLLGGFSSINPYSVDKVSFYNKAVNPAYGDHTSGAIELSSLTNYDTTSSHSAGVNLYDVDIAGNFNIGKKLELGYSARHSIDEAVESRSFNKIIDKLLENGSLSNDAIDKKVAYEDYNLSVKYQPNSTNTFKISGLYLTDKINYELLEDNKERRIYDQLNSSNFGAGIEWYFKSEKANNALKYQVSNYDMAFTRIESEREEEEDEDDSEDMPDYDEKRYTYKANSIIEQGITFIQKRDVNEHSDLQIGYQWNKKDIYYKYDISEDDDRDSDNSEDDVESYALFGNYQLRSESQNFKLNSGARLNYYSTIQEWNIEPRVLVTQRLNSKLKVNSSFEMKSQAAVQTNETVSSSLDYGTQIWIAANGDKFPLLKSSHLTMGGSFTHKGLLIDIDVFRKSIRGLTSLNFGYTDIDDDDYHQGKSQIHGVDIYIKETLSKQFSISTSYSYNDAKNNFENLNNGNRFMANKNILHHLTAAANYSLNSFKIATLYRWHTGIPYSTPTEIVVDGTHRRLVYADLNTSTLPHYQRLDFSAKYVWKPNNKRFSLHLTASVINALNTENILERIYSVNSKTNSITYIDRKSYSPITNASIRIVF